MVWEAVPQCSSSKFKCFFATQIFSGLKIASLNSRVFCSPGMDSNVAVLHVDDLNFASGLLNFLIFYFFNY
jgi:hypothetical protein